MSNPSNAGPYTIGLDSPLSAGEETILRFEEVNAGPADKKGYLKKLYGKEGGIDYIYVVNASDELVNVTVKGDNSFVPPATSQNLESGPFRYVKVANEGSTTINQDSTDSIKVIVGNNVRQEESFSARDAVNDMVPGFNL